ncbi:NmrA family NAD(P)-binding protein [Devosia sp.]|uniref:NmrA family NAD(P)-binding protein n=1 Tax=Devosia sp. TaxID=1871048 RepID=UPI001AC1F4F2|nr:NmrA family NAD(P)-binding protein [Devosia sp.]MBN9336043.1 NmrA family NAD(P)-binding protein [Devosia sp.]
MIMVAGATGHLGSAVVNQLLAAGAKGRFLALARDTGKAQSLVSRGVETRFADYDRPETLAAAFAGVDTLLFISTMSMNRREQQFGVVDAAVAAGVKHIVYTGLAIRDIATSGVRDLMASHFETEAHIRSKGIAHTFLRNTMYAEALPTIIGPQALEKGIFLPAGSGHVPYALRSEMGEAAANVLLQEGHRNKTYDIAGVDAHGYDDVARGLSVLTGKRLAYRDIPAQALRETMQAAGLPEFPIYLTLGTLADIKADQYAIGRSDLELLLGRKPKSLNDMLKLVFA